jgi:carbamoylphosphate synthase large subunit
MKSVGEVMAVGRTFEEAFQKGAHGGSACCRRRRPSVVHTHTQASA